MMNSIARAEWGDEMKNRCLVRKLKKMMGGEGPHRPLSGVGAIGKASKGPQVTDQFLLPKCLAP